MTELEDKELQQAKEYLSYWQPQLRLDHIDFELVLMIPEENKNQLANCKVNLSRHRQKIALRHPSQRSEIDRSDFRRDLEVSVVHELLHIVNSVWMDKGGIPKAMENEVLAELENNANDTIAEALVRARRGITRE
jgi:hypothetical protein